jgi:DNA repair exonuclease SbcCD ATPase subunit
MFKSAREASEAENTQNTLRDQRAKAEKVLARERMNLENCALEEAAWQERHREALEGAARQKQQQVELDKLKLSLKRLQDYQGQLSDHMHFLARCLTVVGREGLPAYLCGSICPALNASALKFSELFTGGALGVQFTFVEGELDIQVENRQGGAGINDQSQGEMRMIGLIAAFALRDVLVPYNLLILDEPGEGLDAMNAKAFADGLSEAAERFGSLFVVTHNVHILAALEPTRRLHVIKENQISRLEEIQ